jgi:hypothetical protein
MEKYIISVGLLSISRMYVVRSTPPSRFALRSRYSSLINCAYNWRLHSLLICSNLLGFRYRFLRKTIPITTGVNSIVIVAKFGCKYPVVLWLIIRSRKTLAVIHNTCPVEWRRETKIFTSTPIVILICLSTSTIRLF